MRTLDQITRAKLFSRRVEHIVVVSRSFAEHVNKKFKLRGKQRFKSGIYRKANENT